MICHHDKFKNYFDGFYLLHYEEQKTQNLEREKNCILGENS